MKDKIPSSIKFLQRFCPANLVEEIEGDLLQRFEGDIKAFGKEKRGEDCSGT